MNAEMFSLFAGDTAWVAAIELAAKSTLLLAVVFLGHAVARRRHVLACSALWNACVLGLLLLPAAIVFAPDFGLPAPWLAHASPKPAVESHAARAFNGEAVEQTMPSWHDSSTVVAPLATTRQSQPTFAANDRSTIVNATTVERETGAAIQSASAPLDSDTDWRMLILLVYGAGIVLFALRFVLNLLAVQQLRSKATPVDRPAWTARLVHWSRMLGLPRQVALRTSDDVSVPVIVGWRRPLILLPPDAIETLSGQRIDGVLVHELAHVRRGDYGWQLLLSLVQVIYWPQPLVWFAGRVIGRVRERACDDLCVHALGGKEEYRATLVDLARALVRRHSLSLGLTAVRSSKIARRLDAIDRSEGNARCVLARPSRWLIAAAFAGLAIVCGAANPTAPETKADEPESAPKSQKSVDQKQSAKAGSTQPGKPKSDEIIGAVVDVAGKPVAGIEVQAIRPWHAGPANPWQTFTTDEQGRFSVLRRWAQDDTQIQLIARDKEGRLGFFSTLRENNAGVAKDVPEFRMVLLPVDQIIRGKVVDEQERPIAGAAVGVRSLYVSEEAARQQANWFGRPEQSPLGHAATKDDGSFTVKVPEFGGCTIVIAHRDFVAIYKDYRADLDDLGTLKLRPGATIRGRAIHAQSGQPVANARISVSDQLDDKDQPITGEINYGGALTDAEGRYEITSLKPGAYNIAFYKSEDQPKLTAVAHERLAIEAGKTTTADFRVLDGRLLAGKVLDIDDGSPVADISVAVNSPALPRSSRGGHHHMRTDAAGSFQFYLPPGECRVRIDEGENWRVPESTRSVFLEADAEAQPIVLKGRSRAKEKGVWAATGSGYGTYSETKATAEKPKEKEIVLRFHTSDGKPVGSTITRVGQRGGRFTMTMSHSGNQHAFPARYLGFPDPAHVSDDRSGATYYLLIDSQGYARPDPVRVQADHVDAPITVDLKTPVFVPIRGRVIDAENRPIESANVAVSLAVMGDEVEKPWGAQYLTNNDGRFEIKHAYVGNRLAIHVTKDGWSGVITDARKIDSAEPIELGELRMTEPNGVIAGRVIDSNKNQPIAGLAVTAENRSDTTDSGGRFRLTRLPVGEVSVRVAGEEYESYFPFKVAVGKQDVVFSLYPKSPERQPNVPMIKGKFQTAGGKPVMAPATLWWIDIAAEPELWMSANRDDGSFEFSNVWQHPWAKGKPQRLVIDVMGYKRPEPIEVATNKNADLTIELEPAKPATVSGRVVDDANKPVDGVTVWTTLKIWGDLQSPEPWGPQTTTDGSGRFAFSHIKDGDEFMLHIGKPGFAGLKLRQTAKAAEPIDFRDQKLLPARATLTGTVVDREKKPVADARVYTNYLGKVIETTTDKEGKFTLAGLPDGNVVVTVESDDFRALHRSDSNSKDVQIEERPHF